MKVSLSKPIVAEYQAARVLFAIGAMDIPRRLNVPGEDLPKVHHLFVEPYAYVRKDALVVGGGNSAAEAALFLSEEGARTTLAIWREDWENRDPKAGAMKHWVRTPLEAEIEAGRLSVVLYKQVDEIRESEVILTTETDESMTIAERCCVCAGGQRRRSDVAETAGRKNRTGKTHRSAGLQSGNFRDERARNIRRRAFHTRASHQSGDRRTATNRAAHIAKELKT